MEILTENHRKAVITYYDMHSGVTNYDIIFEIKRDFVCVHCLQNMTHGATSRAQ